METARQIGLSVIVPVYNEHVSIEKTIHNLEQVRAASDFNMEIIIVNDGSNDGTEELLTNCKLKYIRVITHSHNRGYGAAIKTGIKHASFDYAAITDADSTYPNDRLPELFQIMLEGGFDMVVGARTGENVKIPPVRKPVKWLLTAIANYLCRTKIPDLNSGFRVMKKSLVEKYSNILSDAFSFTTTFTLAMLTNDYSVKYVPVDYHKRTGKSKIRPIHDTLNFLQLIVRTILYFDPLRIFLPMSFLLFILGFALFLYRVFFGTAFGATILTLFLASFQVLAIGLLADLIDRRMQD